MKRTRREGEGTVRFALVVSILAGLLGFQSILQAAVPASSPEPPSRFSIRWVPGATESNRVTVEVSGLSGESARELGKTDRTPEQWQNLLSVHVAQGDLLYEGEQSSMLGDYRAGQGTVRFEPRFPLDPGVRYRAVFHSGALPDGAGRSDKAVSRVFQLPLARHGPGTVVHQVYPSAETLPENLLKFYVHFSSPMRGGHIYEHIHLLDEAGGEIELPFLELDEELWNPAMTRLTLFIDPGRIKREVRPLEEIGPALVAGKRYTLVIDREWSDADGMPLKETFRKAFKVGPPDREPPDPGQWKLHSPEHGSTRPLVISFPEAMDHALAQRMIRVVTSAGKLVEGEAALAEQERRWSFTSEHPWEAGPHTVLVETTIEDLAGNNIGKAFEEDLLEGAPRRLTNTTARLPFNTK